MPDHSEQSQAAPTSLGLADSGRGGIGREKRRTTPDAPHCSTALKWNAEGEYGPMVEPALQLIQEEPRYAYVRLAVMPNAFPGA
ncbi:hypothetical protein [Corynebacterium endometrii]|uniref:hypothetical protein n=1 Tax=Corynebacterium endometrii TaxID=2488819 RepID=UPI00109CCEC8|nr:hypothetical protein [Corynebacterium endometrii]